MQLVRGRGAAGDERLEHAAHHHRLHVLGHGLVVPRGEVVPEARLVWRKAAGRESADHTVGGLVSEERTLLTADQVEFKTSDNREGRGKAYGGEAN